MICSERELGVSDEHAGIIVLPADTPEAPGTDARGIVGLDDVVVDVEITPDRGYQMSVRGLARELAQAFGVAYTDPGLAVATAGTVAPAWDVTIVDQAGCDRFSARLVSGVDPAAKSPDFIQKRLLTAGIRTIDLAVDVTNYVMLELGQPMHAFDADRISGGLTVRRATEGERLTTLDGAKRVLSAEDMVICDDSGPISRPSWAARSPRSCRARRRGCCSRRRTGTRRWSGVRRGVTSSSAKPPSGGSAASTGNSPWSRSSALFH
jgi:phenylalanyl-tRNA synthetase beta chain